MLRLRGITNANGEVADPPPAQLIFTGPAMVVPALFLTSTVPEPAVAAVEYTVTLFRVKAWLALKIRPLGEATKLEALGAVLRPTVTPPPPADADT